DMASIVICLEGMPGRTVWQGRLGAAQREGFSASPVAVDGKLFFTNDDGETFVLRAGPKFELLHVNRIGEGTLAAPGGVGGKPFFTNDDGETFVLRAGPKFELLHVNRIGEGTLASPALVDG